MSQSIAPESLRESVAIDAVRVTLDHTTDVAALEKMHRDGALSLDDVVAVTGKTEGTEPGETSRVDADRALRRLLLERGTRTAEQIAAIPMSFTAGGVGILTPHVVVYTGRSAPATTHSGSRLAIGTARSAIMQPEWTGRARTIEENVAAMRAAITNGGMQPHEVEYLLGKAYYVPREQLRAARASGQDVRELDDEALFRKTSGGAGLAAAVALDGLVVPDDDAVARDFDLWSGKASFSANEWEPVGGDGPHTQVIAFGNASGAPGRLRVGHAVIADFLDVGALARAIRRAGLDVGEEPLSDADRARVVAVYVKVGPGPAPQLRGRRQVVENRNYGNEVKAAVAGMFAGHLQDNLIYISGSATHQGPPGGGTLAVIVDVGD
ncbi:ring-opening amidohydrolase [Microbacter sp. GSS18]|nr:ring-opening amidohydrolase [Microbacter sp. GSS18]